MKKEKWGVGVPSLQELNVCLIGSWIKVYMALEGSLWKSSRWSIILRTLTSYAAMMQIIPNSGKESFGKQSIFRWAINGRWGMVNLLDYGRITG